VSYRYEVAQTVEIADFKNGKWRWSEPVPKTGLVTKVDEHCLSVRRDDTGEHERDVKEHYRPLSGER